MNIVLDEFDIVELDQRNKNLQEILIKTL
jgi:aspartyl-tRNA(Asn)/glutamyl-tRNA(Gln) amidotransferase subunit A